MAYSTNEFIEQFITKCRTTLETEIHPIIKGYNNSNNETYTLKCIEQNDYIEIYALENTELLFRISHHPDLEEINTSILVDEIISKTAYLQCPSLFVDVSSGSKDHMYQLRPIPIMVEYTDNLIQLYIDQILSFINNLIELHNNNVKLTQSKRNAERQIEINDFKQQVGLD